MTREQLRPFVAVAWLGVATTALNTIVPLAPRAGLGDLRAFRDVVLLVHAPATLLPMLGLSLLAFRRAPFAAVVAAAFTFIEKLVELIGQALRLFPPEEVIGGVPARAVVEAVWDQLFFVLWLCNTLGATAAGLLMYRTARPPWLRSTALAFAWTAALLTLVMQLGRDYVGLGLPVPPALLFFAVFTGYRTVVAATLASPAALEASQ